jgi:hypothetical protein
MSWDWAYDKRVRNVTLTTEVIVFALLVVGWLDWLGDPIWVTAAATSVLAAGVVVALFGLRDARKTRDGELVIELSQRWNEPETVESRQLYSVRKASELAELVDRLYPPVGVANPKQPSADEVELFQKLVRWPALIETVGVLREHGAISTEVIFKMWGYSIASAWETWRDAAEILRQRASYPGTFEFFEDLAVAMQKQARKKAKGTATP